MGTSGLAILEKRFSLRSDRFGPLVVKVNEDDHYYNNYIVTYPYRIQEQLGN